MIHPGKQGDNTQLFHAGQHHGVTSFKIHWAYYTEAGPGLQALIFMTDVKYFCRNLTKITKRGTAIIKDNNSIFDGLYCRKGPPDFRRPCFSVYA